MELASNHKSESKLPKKFVSSTTNQIPSYPFQMGRSKFIGSFIHEYSVDSREKHRPSKRARQRIKKRLAKLELEGSKTMSNESGYDTTSGDCQTPGHNSSEKSSFKLTEKGIKTLKNNKNETKQLPNEQSSQSAVLPDYSESIYQHVFLDLAIVCIVLFHGLIMLTCIEQQVCEWINLTLHQI